MDRSIGTIGRVLSVAMGLTLSGCASFDGTPHVVTPSQVVLDLARDDNYGIAAAAAAAAAKLPRDTNSVNNNTREYRNAFLAVQMGAVDAQYGRFRSDLTKQAKVANFGLDLGVLGLTTGGAIAGKSVANALSAGGAGLTGAKASLNKEVYFEKTLPAIVASMDARRLTLKTAIVKKMHSAIGEYSIAEAIIDVSTYQLSASLDAAVEEITGDANTRKEMATNAYNNLVPTCKTEAPEATAFIDTTIAKVRALVDPEDRKPLSDIAGVIGVTPTGSFQADRDAIITRLGNSFCTKADAEAAAEQLRTKVGAPF